MKQAFVYNSNYPKFAKRFNHFSEKGNEKKKKKKKTTSVLQNICSEAHKIVHELTHIFFSFMKSTN